MFDDCTVTIFGKLPLQICTKINCVMKNKVPNLGIVFQTKNKLINVFIFKDKIPVFLRSKLIYKFKYGGCNAAYYVKTKLHFKVKSRCLCKFFMIEEHNLSL